MLKRNKPVSRSKIPAITDEYRTVSPQSATQRLSIGTPTAASLNDFAKFRFTKLSRPRELPKPMIALTTKGNLCSPEGSALQYFQKNQT
jgi:hypothetical protein